MLNQIKTVLLLGILTGILLLIGSFFGQAGLTLAVIFVVLMNFVTYFFSDKFVLVMYHAKLVSKTQSPILHEIIEDLCKKTNLPKPKIYIIPTDNSNAFATGRNPKHAAVAVTNGILHLLSKEELKGVLAHELAHVKNRDILIATIAATVAGIISYLASMARFTALFGGSRDRDSGNIIELLVLAILAPIIALIIQLAISRSREYLADESGASYIKTGYPLASALKKLEISSKQHPLKFGSQATSHLFIVNPFSGKSLMNLFSTHPNTEIRIQKLKEFKF